MSDPHDPALRAPGDEWVTDQLAIKLYELDMLLRIASARGITVTIDTVDRDEYDRGLGSQVTYTSVVAPGLGR